MEKSPIGTSAAGAAQRVWRNGACQCSSGLRLPASGIFCSRRHLHLVRFRRHLLGNGYESAAHFVHHKRKVSDQQRPLRINHNIHGRIQISARQADRLPQAPLHAVALHRAAQGPTHGEAHAQARLRRFLLRSRPVEHGQGRGKVPLPLLVYALEIRMTQKPRGTRKASCLFWRHRRARRDGRDPRHGFRMARPSVSLLLDCESRSHKRATRGNRASPKPVCVPWRGGGKAPSGRPGFSCACENHASSIACAGWVGMYAWA